MTLSVPNKNCCTYVRMRKYVFTFVFAYIENMFFQLVKILPLTCPSTIQIACGPNR